MNPFRPPVTPVAALSAVAAVLLVSLIAALAALWCGGDPIDPRPEVARYVRAARRGTPSDSDRLALTVLHAHLSPGAQERLPHVVNDLLERHGCGHYVVFDISGRLLASPNVASRQVLDPAQPAGVRIEYYDPRQPAPAPVRLVAPGPGVLPEAPGSGDAARPQPAGR